MFKNQVIKEHQTTDCSCQTRGAGFKFVSRPPITLTYVWFFFFFINPSIIALASGNKPIFVLSCLNSAPLWIMHYLKKTEDQREPITMFYFLPHISGSYLYWMWSWRGFLFISNSFCSFEKILSLDYISKSYFLKVKSN